MIVEAETDRETKKVLGEGIAMQRAAICAGLRDSVGGGTPEEVSELLLITQYFDTLEHLAHSPANVVFTLPFGGGEHRPLAWW